MDVNGLLVRQPFHGFLYIDLYDSISEVWSLGPFAATKSLLQFFKRGCVYLGPAAVLKIFQAAIFKAVFGIFKRQGFYLFLS